MASALDLDPARLEHLEQAAERIRTRLLTVQRELTDLQRHHDQLAAQGRARAPRPPEGRYVGRVGGSALDLPPEDRPAPETPDAAAQARAEAEEDRRAGELARMAARLEAGRVEAEMLSQRWRAQQRLIKACRAVLGVHA